MKQEAIVAVLMAGWVLTPTAQEATAGSKKPKVVCAAMLGDDYYEKFFAPPEVAPRDASANVSQGECQSPQSEPCPQLSAISSVASEVGKQDQEPGPVTAECLGFFMKRRPAVSEKIFYGVCQEGSELEATTDCVPPPRLSEDYVEFVRKAFVGAFRCLGEDPRDFVGMVGHESSFQLNIGNSSGAWGPGQIVPIGSSMAVYSKDFEPFRSKPECASYLPAMEIAGIKHMSSCQLSAPPLNPIRNFLLAGLNFKHTRSVAASVVPKSAGRAQIIRDLALDMYNAGEGQILPVWQNYKADVPEGAASYAAFSAAKTGFSEYLRQHFGNETANYAAGVKRDIASANQASRGCAR